MLPQIFTPVLVVLPETIRMVMRIIDISKGSIIANLINPNRIAIILALAKVIPLVGSRLVIIRFTNSDGIIAKRI